MKKIFRLLMLMMAMTLCIQVTTAKNESETTCIHGIKVKNLTIERNTDSLFIDMTIDFTALNITTTELAVFTPYIKSEKDSLKLQAIGVYGRNRYIYYQRNPEMNPIGNDDMVFKANERPDTLNYHAEVDFLEWMEQCTVEVNYSVYECCGDVLCSNDKVLTEFPLEPYKPELIYIRPVAEVIKTRELSGTAFIDFPVSKTKIYPEYRNNTIELAKITGSIDSVKSDPDISITSLSIKGYASPESSYANNTRLARERTQSLKQYVDDLYHFEKGFIKTSYEPENWDGLEAYVKESDLPHKTEILEAIRSDREPDKKEWYIKNNWKDDYKYLLTYCYPALRRTDYRIGYVIREYVTPEEIEIVMQNAPQKLSLEEFYVLSQTYESDSESHLKLWEKAAEMYPQDEVANLNAANSAIIKKDYERALLHLSIAERLKEATYLKGVIEVLRKNYETARPYLEEAASQGVKEAQDTLDNMLKHWKLIVEDVVYDEQSRNL